MVHHPNRWIRWTHNEGTTLMDIVFATLSAVVAHPVTGAGVVVSHGQHWPADDPIAVAYPSHFTADPRFGLSSSRTLRDDGYPVGSEAAAAADDPDGALAAARAAEQEARDAVARAELEAEAKAADEAAAAKAAEEAAELAVEPAATSSAAVEETTAEPGKRRTRR